MTSRILDLLNPELTVAKSRDFETCIVLDTDALASIAPWETGAYYWDPDVIFSGDVNDLQLGFCIEWHTRPLHIGSGKWALVVNFHSFRDRMTKKPLIEDDGRLVLHYSGETKESLRHLCVGFTISEGSDPPGPYHPMQEPLSCHPNNAARPTQQVSSTKSPPAESCIKWTETASERRRLQQWQAPDCRDANIR
ncbi:hypothetical protein PAAG_01694 [Paracoccidioides lutzii Pb01]|uniref:Uncharacterized protein n=1 Tax=Paracoccidioides lutzii (strain ATCC MYA-826 / Pb01) TaxID=502779 RepID=C1GT49_PARBA|nr:hypothetical protein PAAG_01694 [Paracoccidioides lutzii Pb01]EEH39232.2 hypothetical protein PAAG_01694 [Paracoccidioides lutzii Pb01]